MGSHHSQEAKGGEKGGSGLSTPRGSQRGAGSRSGSRSGSGGDLQGLAEKQEKPPPSMVPVEKLGKLLAQLSQKEDGVNGITEASFKKYLFPMYGELASQFYRYVQRAGAGAGDKNGGKGGSNSVPLLVFRQQSERILCMLDDHIIIETYVKMFCCEEEGAGVGADEEGGGGEARPEGLRRLLYTSYKLSMDHYPEGPQTCLMINKTLSAVVNGCFSTKDSHSVGFVVRWVEEHCRRLVLPVHRYCVHVLATRHRDLTAHAEQDGAGAGLELATPVLERAPLGAGSALLPLSVAWLVAGAAPAMYSRPLDPPPLAAHQAPPAMQGWVARLVCAVPVHWAPLYLSREHGLAANRFLHHTLAYRGPTLLLLQAGPLTLALAADREWRDSHRYWGGPDAALLQLQPTFCVLGRGPDMLYLNTAIRGYPRGLRAGSDPRRPLLDVSDQFDTLTVRAGSFPLEAVEVWGCGDARSRETQLEIKRWQVKEAERQRQVKLSAADWIEHPDRYLLELAGRPQYNNSAS